MAALDEYSGPSTPDLNAISDFSSFLMQAFLHELPVTGGTFTWTGVRRHGRIWKKLDRMLFNPAWLDVFSGCSVELLHRATLDHNPLLLKAHFPGPSGPRPFRFQQMWLLRPGFKEVVSASWHAPQHGYGMFLFASKLKRLKFALRLWNRTKFGHVISNLREAEDKVKALEVVFDSSGSDADLISLNEAKALQVRAMAEEAAYLKQKSRVKWLQEGDQNSKLFHTSVAIKHAKLSIRRIKDDHGVWLEDLSDIKAHAVSFFEHLLTADSSVPNIDAIDGFLQFIPSSLTSQDNDCLLKPVLLEEVRRIVFLMDPDSAPGPDGFSGAFFQSCWDIIGHDLLAAVQEFMAGIPIPQSISAAMMILLPKKGLALFLCGFQTDLIV